MTPAPPLYAIALVDPEGAPLGYVPTSPDVNRTLSVDDARKLASVAEAALALGCDGPGDEPPQWDGTVPRIVGLLARADEVLPPRIVGVLCRD